MSITMWKARYNDPVYGPVSVQIDGPQIPGGHYYSAPIHKGHLYCAHCEAKVHFTEGSVSVAGSSAPGRAPHFATNPGEKHEDCLWELKDPSQSEQEIDRTKGYRIHVNVQRYSDLYNNAADGVYEILPNGRTKIRDEDLKDRERITIKDVRHFVTLLEKGDFKRVTESKVVFRNRAYDWDDICVRYGKTKRFHDLIARCKEAERTESDMPFVLMEVRTDKRYYYQPYNRSPKSVRSEAIPMNDRDMRGIRQQIIPEIHLTNRHNTHVLDAFGAAGGRFLVLGQVSYRPFEGDQVTTHFLDIKITDPAQIMAKSVEDIFEKGAARKNRHMGIATPPTQAP